MDYEKKKMLYEFFNNDQLHGCMKLFRREEDLAKLLTLEKKAIEHVDFEELAIFLRYLLQQSYLQDIKRLEEFYAIQIKRFTNEKE